MKATKEMVRVEWREVTHLMHCLGPAYKKKCICMEILQREPLVSLMLSWWFDIAINIVTHQLDAGPICQFTIISWQWCLQIILHLWVWIFKNAQSKNKTSKLTRFGSSGSSLSSSSPIPWLVSPSLPWSSTSSSFLSNDDIELNSGALTLLCSSSELELSSTFAR